jgi:hypothetical protein
MAHPFAPYPVGSTDNGIVETSIEFIVGATGAVPSTLTGGRELGTPVRNGVGDYSFPLLQTWIRLMSVTATVVGAASTTTGKTYQVIADSVTSTSAPLVRIQFTRPDTGAVAEIAQNDVLKLVLRLKCKD